MAEKKYDVLAIQLDSEVAAVIKVDGLEGFKKAYVIAEATGKLQEMLTPEYMKPIMKMQNMKLGFLTDKKDSGYPEQVVKLCLIEAVLTGVQPYGNQFNIISGNMYVTKEGFGYLLGNIPGLDYSIIPSLPKVNQAKDGAAVDMTVSWSINGKKQEKVIPIAVKMNSFMGVDAVIGKATRKARAWLFSNLTGVEVGEGDVQDTTFEEVPRAADGITFEDLLELFEFKKEGLLPTELQNARRILALDENDQPLKDGKPETQSFRKLRDSLKE